VSAAVQPSPAAEPRQRADIERVMRDQMDAYRRLSGPELAAQINRDKEFVLTLGRRFPASRRWRRRGVPKMCFRNSTHVSLHHGLIYVEGFAYDHTVDFLFHHAWVFEEGAPDVAIETTLRDPNNYSFFGVPFTREQLVESMVGTKVYGIIGHQGRSLMQRMLREKAGMVG
jgi:hypothetical protein